MNAPSQTRLQAGDTSQPPHPLTGQKLSGADTIVQVLAEEGVDVLFGYSGGAILPVFDAIFRYNLRHAGDTEPMPLIVPANEQGAGFMAAGYARASGKVGVTLVTSGPGATNLVTPVRDSMADSIPLVVLCGQVATSAIGTDAFQEAPTSNIMSACAKHVFLVTEPAQLEATLRTAFEIARSGRPGPVVVDIPKDVQNTMLIFDGTARLPIPGFRRRFAQVAQAKLGDAACESFFAALAAAERPLIYAGGGVIAAGAVPQLRALAQRYGLPVTTTLMGIGASDTTQPLSLHMLGMHGTAYANYAVEDCDFLLVLGARFDDRVAGVPERFAPNARFIAQFDIDAAEINKVKQTNWHYLGDMRQALNQLNEYGQRIGFQPQAAQRYQAWHAHIAELKRVYAMNYPRDSAKLQPYAVIEAINRLTQGKAIISTGVGLHQMWAAQYFDFREPRQWLSSGAMGTMGFGLPAAIGAQFARREAMVIDIDGDASIRMNIGELETVTTYGLPLKIVVLNNQGDGMVRQWQKLFFQHRFASSDKSLHRKDFIKAAIADGFSWARRLQDPAAIEAVVAEFIAYPGAAFLEVMIDPEAGAYPMIGPGQTYAQMLTGPSIPSREPPAASEAAPNSMF